MHHQAVQVSTHKGGVMIGGACGAATGPAER